MTIDEMQQQEQQEQQQEQLSALHHNIAQKGNHAYYFAHRKRDTGEAPAPPPVHEVLATEVLAVAEASETIFNYLFLDEDHQVKVYIPLEGVAARLAEAQAVAGPSGGPAAAAAAVPEASGAGPAQQEEGRQQEQGQAGSAPPPGVSCSFGEKSMEVVVRGYKPKIALKLAVKELCGSIDAGQCGHKVLANKVVVTLKKARQEGGSCMRWSKLTAK